MMNIIYAALSISAQTEKTTFSCKDDCTWTKHTGRWTYSVKDFEIPLCHIPPLRSFLSFAKIIDAPEKLDLFSFIISFPSNYPPVYLPFTQKNIIESWPRLIQTQNCKQTNKKAKRTDDYKQVSLSLSIVWHNSAPVFLPIAVAVP